MSRPRTPRPLAARPGRGRRRRTTPSAVSSSSTASTVRRTRGSSPREEADERNDEQRRIELVRAVVLLERASRGDAVLEHVGGDCGRGCAPRTRLLGSSPQVRERRAAVGRDPAHHLRRRVVAGLRAIGPRALVRLSPLRHRGVDLAPGHRPDRARQPPAGERRNRGRVDQGCLHVVLRVAHSGVADAHRPRAGVSHQVRELGLVRRVVAVHAVQVLQRPLALGHVRQEREKVVRLPAEAERIQRPKRPRRVADERVAKVPVARAARDARERRRRARPPWRPSASRSGPSASARFGEGASATDGRESGRSRPSGASARRFASMREKASSTVSGGSPSSHESATNARSDSRSVVRADARPPSKPSRRLVTSRRVSFDRRRGGGRPVVAVAVVAPACRDSSVVEHRLAVDRDLDEALHALDRAEEHVVGLDVAGRPPLARGAARLGPRAHGERVANDEQPAPRHPRRLHDHAREEVPLAGRHEHRRGPTRKRPAPRSSSAPKTVGESRSGRQSHSTLPSGATSAATSPSERKARSPIGGNWPATSGAGASRGSRSPPARVRSGTATTLVAGPDGADRGAVIERPASEVATRSSTAGAWRGARRGRRA